MMNSSMHGWISWWIASLALVSIGMVSCSKGSDGSLLENRLAAVEAAAPGVGDVMSNVQLHFAKLYFAVEASNWDLAKFELHEIEENLEKSVRLRPEEKGVQLDGILEAFKETEFEAMNKAVVSKDKMSFGRAYDDSIAVCNSCHTATGRHFIVITLPMVPPVTNQLWKPPG